DERLLAQRRKGSFFQVADLHNQLVEGLALDLISESSKTKQSQIVEGRGTELLRGAAEINGAAQGPDSPLRRNPRVTLNQASVSPDVSKPDSSGYFENLDLLGDAAQGALLRARGDPV